MACNCIKEINERLKEQNAEMKVVFTADGDDRKICPRISLDKVNTRKKAPAFITGPFCPFCGKRYVDEGEQSE